MMNPEEEIKELESLLNELLQAVQLILQSGEELSDEVQGEIAKTFSLLIDKIDSLKPQGGIAPTSPKEPPLEKGMPSSNIHSFGYDPENQRLLVKFQGDYPNENGPIYGYGGVPENIFNLFKNGSIPARTDGKNKWGQWWKGKVPSLGSSMYTLIKEVGYPYQKLS